MTPDGEIVGRHQGLMYHTLGQRKGLGIGGRREKGNKSGHPWFTAAKDLANNQLIVVQGKDHPLLYKKKLTASQLHWISGQPPEVPFHCTAKTRYRQPDQNCVITENNPQQTVVEFETQQFAVTPGQSIVFYQHEICLGGGVIE